MVKMKKLFLLTTAVASISNGIAAENAKYTLTVRVEDFLHNKDITMLNILTPKTGLETKIW